jgi:hypothetical protein
MAHAQSTQPSETSPLLPKPAGSIGSSNTDHDDVIGESAATPDDQDDASNSSNDNAGADIERQGSTADVDSSKHQGMPEVKKQMPFIFPAVAIGVSTIFDMTMKTSNTT